MSRAPVFSLILATVGRTEELRRFLESLTHQSIQDLELIVVDQNDDDRLVPLLSSLRPVMTVRHLHSPRGLSRARNQGLAMAAGTYVAFPDDDCWYPAGLLERIQERFERHPNVDGWTGMTKDEAGRPSASRWARKPGALTKANIWRRAMSPAIFLRRTATTTIGLFNEALGVGAGTDWGSGEETDYLLRGLEQGLRFKYDPALIVLHPQVEAPRRASKGSRAFSYGMGCGWVLRRHRYPLPEVLYHCLRPIGGALVSLVRLDLHRARFSWQVALGRIRGYRTATPLT